MRTNRCHIIGVLDNGINGLSTAAREILCGADLIIGGTRTLKLFAEAVQADSDLRDMTGKLTQVPEWVRAALDQHRTVVVLATGDPLCHGIGRYLLNELGADRCGIMPNTSTLQLAFARLGLSWQEAKICSVHGKDTGDWQIGAGPEHGLYRLLRAVQRSQLLAIFTGPKNGPDRILRMLKTEQLANEFEIAVAERLLQADERIHPFTPASNAMQQTFADPNFVILRRLSPMPPEVLFGLADGAYRQRKPDRGLITRREVRAVSLARLQLRGDSIVWDIGSGSGSVGLEAARLCPEGHVYVIEKNREDAAIAKENRRCLSITNFSLIHAKAPHGMAEWPDPDAVFIGGSGGELNQLIELSLQRLTHGGWLVMNFVTLENINKSIMILKQLQADWDITQLQVSRSRPILDMHRLQAENPVSIVSAQSGVRSQGDEK